MIYVAASIVIIASLAGIVLTIVTLPGIWFMIGVALICTIWQRELLSIGPVGYVWTLLAAVALGVVAEIIEFAASAVGSKRLGGTRAGAWMSILGGLIGALVATPLIPIPILGTILGAVIGAGAGAFVGERGISKRGWRESAASGRGAATGRAVAIVVKGSIAAVIALILSVGAFVG